MAGASAREIKNRIRSMESTKQITRAMEMVAASKLRKTQQQALLARPYFKMLWNTMQDILHSGTEVESPYLTARPVKNIAYIVIAGDRGLAGGYNSNVLKLAMRHMEGKSVTVLPIGRKAADYFAAHAIPLLTQEYREAEGIKVGDCFSVAKQLCKAYQNGQFDEIRIVYTNFVSVLTQAPESRTLLPLQPMENTLTARQKSEILYEPDSMAVFEAVVPEYLGGILYGALCESRASEQAARRSAMDAATQNADEMIGDLRLKFNRARQASITQEITEIVAGA